MSLVSSDWLEKNLNNVKIIDCSWHMPGINRNPYEEYLSKHIPGAIFFDLDKNSEQKTDLPHMLPTKEKWEQILSSLKKMLTILSCVFSGSFFLKKT